MTCASWPRAFLRSGALWALLTGLALVRSIVRRPAPGSRYDTRIATDLLVGGLLFGALAVAAAAGALIAYRRISLPLAGLASALAHVIAPALILLLLGEIDGIRSAFGALDRFLPVDANLAVAVRTFALSALVVGLWLLALDALLRRRARPAAG